LHFCGCGGAKIGGIGKVDPAKIARDPANSANKRHAAR
jgi:hypothetical protein